MKKTLLNIAVALHCEAKPIIEAYQLKKITHLLLPFPVFTNKEKSINLIVAGIGKVKMAAATTFIHLFSGSQKHACFLNIGVAGSTEFALGEAVMPNKIIEISTQRDWFPYINFPKNKQQTVLMTHDIPQVNYPKVGMIDMEGAAFFQTAALFTSIEHIQLVKVISDNNNESLLKINEESVKQLIYQQIDFIIKVIQFLREFSFSEYALSLPSKVIEEFLSQWRFSHAQTLQLKEQLRRWQLIFPNQNAFIFCLAEKKGADVINKVIEKMDSYANSLC